MRSATETTELYRHFNDKGELLYIGVTFSTAVRNIVHRQQSPWWHEVTRTEIETIESRSSALEVESEAIRTERPRYNKVDNGFVNVRSPRPPRIIGEVTAETEARLRAASKPERDAAIRQARLEGATLRQIAAVVGLTHKQVSRILKENQQ